MSRALVTIAMFAFVIFLAWYAGADFSERGFWPAYAIAVAVFGGVMAWTFPGWRK